MPGLQWLRSAFRFVATALCAVLDQRQMAKPQATALCAVLRKSLPYRNHAPILGPMLRNVLMLLLCLAVAGGMGGTLWWFTRRLRRIQQAKWGDKA